MAIKRKSRSARTDPSAATEDSRVKRRVSSAAAVEADGGIVAEEQVAAGASISAVDEAGEKVSSPPVQIDNPEEEKEEEDGCKFLGEPVPENEARARWPHRYQESKTEVVQARCHFTQAEVDGQVYCLEDDAYVKGEPGKPNYIGRIIEIFKAVDGSQNFAAQWYYRGGDTVLQKCDYLIDSKCIFFSEIKDDNPLDCLVKKLKIGVLPLKADLEVKEDLKSTCDYYYAKKYLLPYSSFVNLLSDNYTNSDESGSTVSSDGDGEVSEHNNERTLLDLYSGCGGMSTGLCLGANSCGVKLVTKWAVDINEHACESLKLNHPETQVRNEPADRFLHLLKEWEKLSITISEHGIFNDMEDDEGDEEDEAAEDDSEVFEVDEIVDVCYGDPNKTGNTKLHFKIRWKGYGPNADTWEPLEGLSGCPEKLKEYVSRGNKTKMLPLPGTVDVLCGGPPCQGISGFNRFRNTENPLQDEKNEQLSIFMDIVAYLRPKFVLMENVVDIVRFAGGFLGRYALGRLLSMDYQARMGMMAAGAYGLPQFRMRMFMWGALPTERLPQYPLPTHNVVVRGNAPTEFEANVVAYEERREVNLARELLLGDAISDLPPVANNESRDEMPYENDPETEFQRFIRLRKNEMPGSLMFNSEVMEHSLYDHRPLQLNQDDYERVCRIPKKKGANFRDLPGVRVLEGNNKVEWDPAVERQTVSSGKPLVPDYAMTFVRGTSSKPFGRLWWDETVPTVVTRAEPHNQVILHPLQDRVLTIRENARLQGFPDHYKLVGPIKERYKQVGNAVAVPVARALGFSLALALRGLSGNEPVLALPEDYPLMRDVPSPTIVML